MMDKEIFFREECHAIQGAVFEVYRQIECGFLEAVYRERLEWELAARHIPFVAQPELNASCSEIKKIVHEKHEPHEKDAIILSFVPFVDSTAVPFVTFVDSIA